MADIIESVGMDEELAANLKKAEEEAAKERYKAAYRLYRLVIPLISENFQTYSHFVEPGEYCSQIANNYNTTCEAIKEANERWDPNNSSEGRRIVIPVIP